MAIGARALGRVGVAVAVLACVAAAPAGAAKISFVRQCLGCEQSGLWTMRPDGSGLEHVLATDGDTAAMPAWRPDRRRIFFIDIAATVPVWSVRPDGGDRRALEALRPAADVEDLTWRPDGRRIAFTVVRFGEDEQLRTGIAVAHADGTHVKRITKVRPFGPRHPTFSPNGKRIAYERDARLWRMRADGTRQRKLGHAGMAFDPAWSPDGERIAYSKSDSIYTIRPNGTGNRMIADAGGYEFGCGYAPAWSPNGRRIVFECHGFDVVNRDGSGRRNILRTPNLPWADVDAAWR